MGTAPQSKSNPTGSTPGQAHNVVVIHGPNLNLLGRREPAVYGSTTLPELDASVVAWGAALGLAVTTHQANSEGRIIDLIQTVGDDHLGIVINPGGFTHTSVAILDALRAVDTPAIEVHLSNLYRRESLRHVSVTGAACVGVIMGLGVTSYHLALRYFADLLETKRQT